MMLSTRFVHGAPYGIELATPDPAGAAAFYAGLFGWRFGPTGPEDGGPGVFRLGGSAVAGARRTAAGQGPASWTALFHSADADATAEAAEQARGTVLEPPADGADGGRAALLADRAGVAFGVRGPGRAGGTDLVRVPGSLCWLELCARDIPAAAGFYHRVLGWETSSVTHPGGRYTCLRPAGQEEDAVFGGLVPLGADPAEADDAPDPYWLAYIEAADPDTVTARTRELGGAVRRAPADLPDVGRVAQLTDPHGARFAVVATATGP